MDYTKGKIYVGFKHTEKGESFWVNKSWTYDEESPQLFPYNTPDEIKHADYMLQTYTEHWGLKDVAMVMFKMEKVIKTFEKPAKNAITNKSGKDSDTKTARKTRKTKA